MSHFAVLVKVSPEKLAEHNYSVEEAIAKLMAPYQENNMGTCPPEFMEFVDYTEEIEEECKVVIDADHYLVTEEDKSAIGKTILEHYGSFDNVATEYFGYRYNEEQKAYGSWANPNSKWDWYQIGGRWAGWLPCRVAEDDIKNLAYDLWEEAGRPESDGIAFYYAAEKKLSSGEVKLENSLMRGRPSLLMDNFEYEASRGDVVPFKNLDFAALGKDAVEELEKFYKSYSRWKALKENPNLPPEEDDRWLDWNVKGVLRNLGSEDRDLTLEILKAEYAWNWEFSTFAVVETNGEWIEKGEMGWFGCSSDNPSDGKNWSNSFSENFIKNSHPNTLFAIVDCHI